MTILVTGGAGFIGSHVSLALLDAGHDVVVIDNLSTGLKNLAPSKAKFVEMDLRDEDRLQVALRENEVEAVIHCAASTVVGDSIRNPLAYYDNNVGSTLSLLHAMRATTVRRLIFSSTAAVYGVPKSNPIPEDSHVNPTAPYGASKLMVERIIADLALAGELEYSILRYFNVAGADPEGRSGQSTPAATHLIKVACEVACGTREALSIYGTDWPTADGTCVRDYIHVSDLAQAHLLALAELDGRARNAVFNCGYGRGYSVREVVAALERVTGRKLPVVDAERRLGDVAEVVADGSVLQKTLNWRPKYGELEQIVLHSLQWEMMQTNHPATKNYTDLKTHR